MSNSMKHTILAFLSAMAVMTSCVYDHYPENGEEADVAAIGDGYALNLTVTLDNMGGTKASSGDLAQIENYIDPYKLRVLFFDGDEKFLFESKSRRVTPLPSANGYSRWLISIPFITAGNEYDWNWAGIRTALTTRKFKIAILANRPDEFFNANVLAGRTPAIAAKWYPNGPDWGVSDSGDKELFDLHHSQHDPIYHERGLKDIPAGSEGFYDFLLGKQGSESCLGGAVSCWVDMGTDGTKFEDKWNTGKIRYNILPDYDYPIPMYGIQEFPALTDWKEGTTYDLTSQISLLRSVVKLELLIPKSVVREKPDFVLLWYSNIYARCEPMDIWTPTDKIWERDHANCTEWQDIMDYGPITRNELPGNNTDYNTSFNPFRQRISWFYGSWLEKGWQFGTLGRTYVENAVRTYGDSPRIFNPCTMRNERVLVETDIDDGSYWHYVAYTGERNINDPSQLPRLDNTSSGQPTLSYWMIGIGGTLYGIPIADYGKVGTGGILNPTVTVPYTGGDPANIMTLDNAGYMVDVQRKASNTLMPWPLIRNHVYRLTISATRAGGDDALSVLSEELRSESIKFGR